jgi:hypothetical protein
MITSKNFTRTLLAALKYNNYPIIDLKMVQRAFYQYAFDSEYQDLFVNVEKTTEEHLKEYEDIDTFEDKEPHLFLSFDVCFQAKDMCSYDLDGTVFIFKGHEVLDEEEANIFPKVNKMVNEYLYSYNKNNKRER